MGLITDTCDSWVKGFKSKEARLQFCPNSVEFEMCLHARRAIIARTLRSCVVFAVCCQDKIEELTGKVQCIFDAAIARTVLNEAHTKNIAGMRLALDPSKGTTAEIRDIIEEIDSDQSCKLFGAFKAWEVGKLMLKDARDVVSQNRADNGLMAGYEKLAEEKRVLRAFLCA